MKNKERKALLEEMLTWLRPLAYHKLTTIILPGVLDSTKKRRVYEMTDGEKPIDEIAQELGVSVGTVSNWWNQWYAKGLLCKRGKRYQKLISIKGLASRKGGEMSGK